MVRLYARHPVTDYATWRAAYDGFDAERSEMGVTGHAVYQAVDDPNDITIWHDFNTGDEAAAFAASTRLKEVMQGAGVAGPPSIWIVDDST